MSFGRGIVMGAAAGAAGTTALNAVTYLDVVVRARPMSSTPQETVERLAEKLHVTIPGRDGARANRVAGMGPLTGLATGVSVGAVLGISRSRGRRPGLAVSVLAATIGALLGSNGPMSLLGVTNPRTWTVTDWVSDVVPHLAYGAATAGTLLALDRQRRLPTVP